MPLAMRALLLEEAPKNVPFTCHFSRVSFLIFFFFLERGGDYALREWEGTAL